MGGGWNFDELVSYACMEPKRQIIVCQVCSYSPICCQEQNDVELQLNPDFSSNTAGFIFWKRLQQLGQDFK